MLQVQRTTDGGLAAPLADELTAGTSPAAIAIT